MRTRPADGLSEQTDAIVIVVSNKLAPSALPSMAICAPWATSINSNQQLKVLLPPEPAMAPRNASWSPMQWLGAWPSKKNKTVTTLERVGHD
jgi:hypothetical protein